eukprot:TRINITY_DN67063_c0_g1_i1.p1 TRINITY_DN67063_c0_g1~~TRINITY_DN67063_c0_g1_i1.p1  ORF type:complete len:373 (-),score=45.72 TRINITY_DN67063_c0_g1_i1:59-1177(-)
MVRDVATSSFYDHSVMRAWPAAANLTLSCIQLSPFVPSCRAGLLDASNSATIETVVSHRRCRLRPVSFFDWTETLHDRALATKEGRKAMEQMLREIASGKRRGTHHLSSGGSSHEDMPRRRQRLKPCVYPLGDAIGLHGHYDNWIVRSSLGKDDALFCRQPGDEAAPLPKNHHPALEFKHPVRNIHVELRDMGRLDSVSGSVEKGDAGLAEDDDEMDETENLLWDADFAKKRGIRGNLARNMSSDSGAQEGMLPVCPSHVGVPHVLELHVTADDVERTSEGGFRPSVSRVEQGVDEVAQFQVVFVTGRSCPSLPPHHHGEPALSEAAPCLLLFAPFPTAGARHWPHTRAPRRRGAAYQQASLPTAPSLAAFL